MTADEFIRSILWDRGRGWKGNVRDWAGAVLIVLLLLVALHVIL